MKNIIEYTKIFIVITILYCKTCASELLELDEIKERLEKIVSENYEVKKPRQVDAKSWIWEDYTDGTGFGNREELLITSIDVWEDLNVPKNIENWQVVRHEGSTYFAGTIESTLFLFYFDMSMKTTFLHASINVLEKIKTFKIISFNSNIHESSKNNEIYAVLSIEMNNINFLKWYQLFDNKFVQIWIWKLAKPIKNFEYFNIKGRDKLLLLYEKNIYFDKVFSPIEIYDIKINGYFSKLDLCHQLFAPDTSDVQICPSYHYKTLISLLSENRVVFYEYKDEDIVMCTFKDVQNITINGLINSVCFESGYIHYMVTSGSVVNLFKYHTNQFLYDKTMENLFLEIGNVNYIHALPVDTYKDEVVLLIQLKNSTILALSWQGSDGFKLISLPNQKLDYFDLSKTTVIPNFGLLCKNVFIKFNIKLKQLPRPNENKLQKMLEIKSIFEDFLEEQKLITIKNNLIKEHEILNDIESNEIFNLTEVFVEDLLINETNDFLIEIESKNITFEELHSNYLTSVESINELETIIDEIEVNIRTAIMENVTDTYVDEIDVTGELDIKGTLSVDDLTIDRLNDIPIKTLLNECTKSQNSKITGTKYFPTIDFTEENLKIKAINGIPLSDIEFQDEYKNYTGIDLSNVTKLKVEKNLNLRKINGINWRELMQNSIFKDQKTFIPGTMIISGDVSANYIFMDYLNELKYPSSYVMKSGPEEAEITGVKTFDSLLVSDLAGVKFINDVDSDDFIYLNEDHNLTHQITFENLVIEENLQIDGKIVGLPEEDVDPDLTLLNSNVVQSNVNISTLYVTGRVYVENLINGTEWSQLDDLILNDEKNVTVTGTKTFLSDVYIAGEVEIKTGVINGRHISDYVTLDTEQVLPNLSRISGDVTFEKVSYEDLKNLEKEINSTVDHTGSRTCMNIPIAFEEPPIFDQFFTSYVNNNITYSEFSKKFEYLLQSAHFEHVKVKKLIANELEPVFINNINYQEFKDKKISKTAYQSLTGNITIKFLDVNKLYADYVNGKTSKEIEKAVNTINELYQDVFDGKALVESLNVTGVVVSRYINEEDLYNVFDVDNIETFIFKTNVSIDNVMIDGFINGLNFSKKVQDAVMKNEENVVIKGIKKISKLKTQNLQVQYLNRHSVDDIISPYKNQTLTGPVKIKGSVEILKNLNTTGKVNNIKFNNVGGFIKKLDNEVYKLFGDFIVYNDTFINNLNVHGQIQYKNIKEFMENLIYLGEKDVVITGAKIFNNPINFKNNIILVKNVNELDLEYFYENAVLIDRPISINSKVIFENDIMIEKDLKAGNLIANKISNIDIDELMQNAIYLDRPTSVIGTVTVSDVDFKSDITVESWNNVKMDSVITLNEDQIIPSVLMCVNATVEKIEIGGFVNGENLTKMYTNTFMLSTDQNITGQITFLNNVYAKQDFNSQYINNVDITKAVSLNNNDPLVGNFIFINPIVIHENLEIRGKLNGIDLRKLQSKLVKTKSSSKQIVSGNWTIHGNVHFERNVHVSSTINEVNVRKLNDDINKHKSELDAYISSKKKNLREKCDKLHELKNKVNKMPYKFKTFEHLRMLEFDQKVFSVYHFEFNNIDYMMVNFETCYLDVYAYTDEGFVKAAEIIDFGIVKQYITFSYKNYLYFVTHGRPKCGKSSGNLWVLQDYQFKHILDLGNVTDMQKLRDNSFAVVVDHQVREWSIQNIYENLYDPVYVFPIKEKNVHFFLNENDTLLASRESIYGINVSINARSSEFEEYKNPFDTSNILSFRAGINQKEFILYHEDQISNDYIFICNNDLYQRKILQTIQTKKPNSFIILNFEGFHESLLIFTENKRKIQIYQYKGLEIFKYHSSIKLRLDKVFTFKLRTHPYFAKKNCLAVVQENKLIILEAKMYGEKLNVNDQLTCDDV